MRGGGGLLVLKLSFRSEGSIVPLVVSTTVFGYLNSMHVQRVKADLLLSKERRQKC